MGVGVAGWHSPASAAGEKTGRRIASISAVGVVVRKKRGEAVMAGKPVFEVHHGQHWRCQRRCDLLRGCFRISDNPPPPQGR